MNVYIAIIIAYFAMVIAISFLTKKVASKSAADFLVAGRNMGLVVCAVVVAAEWLGGMSTIGVSEKAFNTGTMVPILYNLSTAAGMIIIGYTVASHYRNKDVHTVSEMLHHLFGSKARNVSAVAFLVAYITLAYVQLQTCAGLFGPIMGLGWTESVLIASVIITIYTYIGGMHALAVTGLIHVAAMFIGVGIAFVSGMIDIGWFSGLTESLMSLNTIDPVTMESAYDAVPKNYLNPFSAGFNNAFTLLLGGVLGGMAGQASIQPIFGARTADTAKRAAVLSAFIIAPFGIMIAFLGLMAKTGRFFDLSTLTNSKMVLSTLLTSETFINPYLGALALAGVLAAILSTVGPVNFAVVTIATKDIYHGLINKEAVDLKILRTAKNMVIVVNVITIPLAIYVGKSVLDAAYISYAIRAIGAIVILLGIYKKGWINALGVQMAFIGGTATIIICVLAQSMGWFSVDKTYGAVGAAIFFIALGKIIEKSIKPKIS
jgi:SSS family solute:Na+ symporter